MAGSAATVSIVDSPTHPRPRAIHSLSLWALALAVSLLAFGARATTYYVAPNGSDSAVGSLAQPWATLQKGLQTIAAGDTILMQPGNYDYQHNIDTVVGGAARTTIRANGGPVVLSGAGICINNINYTLDGLTFTNITFAHHINACVAVNTGGHGLQILNCRMMPVNAAVFGVYWLDVPDSNPATHETPDLTAGNCIISNNILSQLAGCHAIKIGGSNTMVLNNIIRDSITIDLFVIHGCSNVVRGNYVTNIVQVQGLGIHPDIIQTWGQLDLQPNAPFCDSYGNIVEGNRFYNFDGALSQLTCDYSPDGTMPTVGGWIVRNNLYVRCGPIGGGSVSSVDIPNSRFYNNTYIQCGTDPQDSGGCIGFAYHTARNGSATNCYVYNNAFIACGNNTSSGWYTQEGDMSSSLWNLSADYNLVVHWTGSSWGTKTGFKDPHGLNLGTDPKIVSMAMGLGRPLSGSPMINAGANVSPYVVSDLEGALRPLGGNFDIGCYEFDPSLQVHLDFKENFVTDNLIADTTGYGHNAVNLQPGNWITSAPGLSGSAGKWTVVGVMTNDPGQTYNLSQYAAITNLNGIQFITNGTISVWVQWATNGERWDTILDCGYSIPYSWDPTVATNSWALHYGSPDLTYAPTGPVFKRFGNSLNDTNGVLISWTQPRDGSNWWNIAVAWDGVNNTIIGYQNGVPIQTNALGAPYLRISGSPRLGTPPYSITPWLSVGAMQHDGTPQWGDDRYPNAGFFKGKMDDLRIYNRTLASQEIRTLYQGPLATVQSSPPPSPLSIVTQPQSSTVVAGGTASFSVTAVGTSSLSYQWYQNGASLSGATSSSYSKSNVQSGDAGNYVVVVSNSSGSLTSSVAVLTVSAASGVAPTITQQPSSVAVTTGSTATFTVVASGSAPLSYQWYLNGNAIAGASASSYAVTSAQSTDAGTYAVYVANTAGSALSSNAVLTVQALPVITAAPASVITNVGAAITFSVAASGVGQLSYQWRYNGTSIAGATGTSFTRTNVQTFQAGSYSVLVSNSGGTVASQPAVLSVRELNLRLHLDFDEDFSGGRVMDVSGNGNDAWQFNPYSWITPAAGAFSSIAAQFAYTSYLTNASQQVFPVSQYLAITNPAGFLTITNGTISVWAQFSPNSDNWMRVLDNGYSVSYATGGSAASNSWTIGRDSTPNLTFLVYPADGTRKRVVSWPNDVDSQYATAKLHLYSLSIDCVKDRVVAYYDGAPYMTNSIGLPWIRVYGGSGGSWLCIGAAAGDGTPTWGSSSSPHAGYFTGKLDGIRIYSRTLSPMEVKSLYDALPLPAPPKNLFLIPSGS